MTTKINTPAVQVIKASKGYGNGAPVINNMTMTVQSGTMWVYNILLFKYENLSYGNFL
jgi:hypothetical protein